VLVGIKLMIIIALLPFEREAPVCSAWEKGRCEWGSERGGHWEGITPHN